VGLETYLKARFLDETVFVTFLYINQKNSTTSSRPTVSHKILPIPELMHLIESTQYIDVKEGIGQAHR
jgi:hypothetical protein